jgi:hypothetical protein
LIFGVKRVPSQTLHPAATFLCVAKLKLLLPCSMLLLLLLQLLSWWAVSATAVPVARMQRHRLLLRRPHGNQLSNSPPSPELSHDRQSPMKNFEVSFSLLELEFHCKNLFLIWGKHWGARI